MMLADSPETVSFVPPVGVRRLQVGDQVLIFNEDRQQLFALNETADQIWRGFSEGADAEKVAAGLAEHGVPAEDARRFVAEAAEAWTQGGHLLPQPVMAALSQPPRAARTLSLDEIGVVVTFHGQVTPEVSDEIFAQFYGPAALPGHWLAVVGHGGRFFFLRDGRPVAVTDESRLASELKAQLTDLYANGFRSGFLAHGGLLTRNGRTVFLSGAPGAGKTTLTLALAAAGWAFCGDDIVRVHADGLVRAMPFAAAVKSGAWELLEPLWPEVGDLQAWVRSDGQITRYFLPPNRADREARPLDGFVILAREAGAAPRLELVEPAAALAVLLESAYAAGRGLEPGILEAVAGRLGAVVCRRLVYDDLTQAVQAMEGLFDVPS